MVTRTKVTITYRNINARTTDPKISYEATDEAARPLKAHPEVWNNVLWMSGVFETMAEARHWTSRYVRNMP